MEQESAMTIASLVDETLAALHGFTREQERTTSLAGPMTDTATAFTVSDTTAISQGLVEIEDELVAVARVDANTGTATVEPWGRGQAGSVATAHSAGVKVTGAPLFPRQRVAAAIYGVLREAFPAVYSVAQVSEDASLAKTNYVMPVDCHQVLSVETQIPGPSGMWAPVDRWRENRTATGIELEVLGYRFPGLNHLRVTYVRTPPTQFSGSDDLADYGYDLQVRDLIVLGALARMVSMTEAGRIHVSAVESVARAEAVPAGSATNAARYLYQVFNKRLADERAQLLIRHPPQKHFTR